MFYTERDNVCWEDIDIMSYFKSQDGGGKIYSGAKVYLSTQLDFDWILNHISSANEVDIITYSLSRIDFIDKLIKAGKTVKLITNPHSSTFDSAYSQLEKLTLDKKLIIQKNDHIHSKWILADNDFVYTGSQNIANSNSFENIVMFHDSKIYQYYKDVFNAIFEDDLGPYNIKPNNYTNVESKPNKSDILTESNYDDNSIYTVDDVTVKFSAISMVNWNQKFNGYHNRNIIITTLSIPKFDYANEIIHKLVRQGNNVTIIANNIAEDKLKLLKEENPSIEYFIKPNIHAKLVLVGGIHKIVWSSSQNFGSSTWTEDTINLKSDDNSIYDFFQKKLRVFLGLD